EDVGTVVNAVEVDRLAVVAFPCAVRWRGEADHRGQRRPAINVRHHLVVLRARRNMIRPPHDARNAPTSLKGRTFLSTEGVGAAVRVSVLPGTVVAVVMTMVSGASARMTSMIRPMLSSSSSIASEYRPRCVLPTNFGAGLFGLCIFMKFTSTKNGLSSLACFLMYSMALSAWRTSKVPR